MQVGRYELIDLIGTGANSRVMRAHDPMIGRTVAVKLFSSALAQGDARQQFLQEARVVGQLSHPSIITLHDMGIEESTSTPYLVMEYLEGQSLDRMLEKGSIPFPRACALVAEVAVALHAAHKKGVIHGDVKPANILVTENNRIKLMDFGMARLASHDTAHSPLLGTPAYWCPEQILGRAQDARSDIFSLGVVLYEMVTGNRPFDADSLQGVCARVLSSTHLPASHANPSLPSALNDVINSCLMKEPSARVASAELLATSLYPLARIKQTPQITPQPTGLRHRAARLLRSA